MYNRKLAVAATVLTLGFGSAAMSQTMAQSLMNEDGYSDTAPRAFDPLGDAADTAGAILSVPGAVIGAPGANQSGYVYGPEGYRGQDFNSGYETPAEQRDEQRNGNVDRN